MYMYMYRAFIGIIFPFSLLTGSKFLDMSCWTNSMNIFPLTQACRKAWDISAFLTRGAIRRSVVKWSAAVVQRECNGSPKIGNPKNTIGM